MKALVFTANEEVQYREEPAPEAGPGEAIVAVDAVGICGSDMHAYLGRDPRRVPPVILGHEAAGTVLEGSSRGLRVVINPLIACGTCDDCLGGRSNLCADRDSIGLFRPGAFAERVAVPAGNLIPIPADMDPAHAALTEPAATALHAVGLAARASYRPLNELRSLVIGAGSIGLFAALALADHGAPEVFLAEVNPLRRRSARATGVAEVFDPRTSPPRESTFDLVIDAVGGRSSREMAVAAVRPGGVVVHVGLLDNEGSLDVRKLTFQEIAFIGAYTYTPVDLRATVRKLHGGAFGNLAWLEQRPMKDGALAFDDLARGRSAAAKIVLRP